LALDALGVEQTAVFAGLIGAVWALRLATRHPSRVKRVVLLGGALLLPESRIPVIVRLLRSPIGAMMVRLPETPARMRLILRQNGHGVSLDAGRIPEEFVQWRGALTRETDSMRHERDMVRVLMSWADL
jgi:pimeloyl-ACP methyl ester carboxylesterase